MGYLGLPSVNGVYQCRNDFLVSDARLRKASNVGVCPERGVTKERS